MKNDIEKLLHISQKNKKTIIGTMSGTSLDGLDVAVCRFEGHGKETQLFVSNFKTIPYSNEFKKEIRKLFSNKNGNLELLCLLNAKIGIMHAQMINDCIEEWGLGNESIDLIANHGQTVYHAPESFHKNKLYGNCTLQIGDGDHIAVKTGIITVSDFRQKHVAAGGEGAPLAAYGDYLLFAQKNRNTILLNIGGIANFTFIPADSPFERVSTCDTGPGNILMDAWTRKHFAERTFDDGAKIALSGNVNENLLMKLKHKAKKENDKNKSTGAEIFNMEFLEECITENEMTALNKSDVMATLNRFTSELICERIEEFAGKNPNTDLLISGGGIHNPMLINFIKTHFRYFNVKSTAEKNIDPDAKEAVLFAILANETITGNGDCFRNGSSSSPGISMGKISLPK